MHSKYSRRATQQCKSSFAVGVGGPGEGSRAWQLVVFLMHSKCSRTVTWAGVAAAVSSLVSPWVLEEWPPEKKTPSRPFGCVRYL